MSLHYETKKMMLNAQVMSSTLRYHGIAVIDWIQHVVLFAVLIQAVVMVDVVLLRLMMLTADDVLGCCFVQIQLGHCVGRDRV